MLSNPQYDFALVRQQAGPEFEIRSLALSFQDIGGYVVGMETDYYEMLLERVLKHRFLEESVLYETLYQTGSPECPRPTVVTETTKFELWFPSPGGAQNVELFIRFLHGNAYRFSEERIPVLKFMTVNADGLNAGDISFSESCYSPNSVK
jgi:hypothetical protein